MRGTRNKNILCKKMNPSNNLPGLFHYKAATYGDAIGLTILIGSLVAFEKKKLS